MGRNPATDATIKIAAKRITKKQAVKQNCFCPYWDSPNQASTSGI